MNLQEFAALKVGDKIVNGLSGSPGVVSKVVANGVHVVWGARSDTERPFYYDVAGTTWFNWNKSE